MSTLVVRIPEITQASWALCRGDRQKGKRKNTVVVIYRREPRVPKTVTMALLIGKEDDKREEEVERN